jgi:hypothetical protein
MATIGISSAAMHRLPASAGAEPRPESAGHLEVEVAGLLGVARAGDAGVEGGAEWFAGELCLRGAKISVLPATADFSQCAPNFGTPPGYGSARCAHAIPLQIGLIRASGRVYAPYA